MAFPCFAYAKQSKYFFCDYLGVPILEPHNHTNRALNQVFYYNKSHKGWTASFGSAKMRNGFLHGYYSSGQVGSDAKDWEVFDVYRFHLTSQILTHSIVYYTPKEAYKKNLKARETNPYLIPYSQTPLEFIEKETPKNYIKYGFDKSEWQCHQLSYFKYLIRKLERELFAIFSI